MEIKFDFHTHTKYSHGKGTVLENALSAKEKGLSGIGITDHGFSHPAFGMSRSKLDKMRADCDNAQKQTGVKVLLGIESNLLGVSGKTDVKVKDYQKLDIFLAGVHRFILYDGLKEWFKLLGANYFTKLFNKNPSESLIKRNTQVYINAIKSNPIDVITHVNYLVFADAVEVAKCCADYGTYFEINTKKVHLSDEVWQKVVDTGVNFVVDSDAHSPDRIGDTRLATELLQRVDIPLDRIKNLNGMPDFMRFADYKDKL